MKNKRVNHGLSNTRLYRIWYDMRRRCNNPKRKDYKHYGGRGIKVCKKWEDSFISFKEDIGASYNEGLELDRIDTNGDYTPENCRWTTRREQVKNRRSNGSAFDTKIIEKDGLSLCQSEWADVFGLGKKSISDRMNKLGWDKDKALSGPKRGKTSLIFNNESINPVDIFVKVHDYLNNSRAEKITPQQYLANILPFTSVLYSFGGNKQIVEPNSYFRPRLPLPELKGNFKDKLTRMGISYER